MSAGEPSLGLSDAVLKQILHLKRRFVDCPFGDWRRFQVLFCVFSPFYHFNTIFLEHINNILIFANKNSALRSSSVIPLTSVRGLASVLRIVKGTVFS